MYFFLSVEVKMGRWLFININKFLVQPSTPVSFAGLSVLRTLYKPMVMHKGQIAKIVNYVFYKSCR